MNSTVCGYACEVGANVLYDVPLKKLTTFKVGGNCSALIIINSVQGLTEIIKLLNEENEPFFVLGKGSNIIADDKGYNGTIIKFGDEMSEIAVNDEIITAGSGASLSAVCKVALDNCLTGIEFAYGIPGSVGGGVYMNAGAYGGEIKDIIVFADAMNPVTGEITRFSNADMLLSYRKSIFAENKFIILSATFKLTKGNKNEIKSKMSELMEKRKSKQPLEYPSAGSTFKRPEGAFAAKLIEDCGLKGYHIGDAEISEKHSGFVINKGNASSADILKLISDVRNIVFEKTGFRLETEPVILK